MVMKALVLVLIHRYGSWNTDEKFMLRIVSCPQPPLKFLEGREFTIVEVNATFFFPGRFPAGLRRTTFYVSFLIGIE
jgi:hypothetical protein